MWLPGHVKQLQQDATPCFPLALKVQMKPLLVTPDGWFSDWVLLNLKNQPFFVYFILGLVVLLLDWLVWFRFFAWIFFYTLNNEKRVISIGSSSIVKAIKAKNSQCCGLFHNNTVSLGSSCSPLEGHCPGAELPVPLGPCSVIGQLSFLESQSSAGATASSSVFRMCGTCFYCVNFGGDENGQADNPEIFSKSTFTEKRV